MNFISNINSYKRKYKNKYGLQVPDGHIIRIYKQIVEYELKKKKGNLLDYGCGNGIHSKWITENGNWIPYGYDINLEAIKSAKKNNSKYKKNFFQSNQILPDLKKIFKVKFDFIICNQVLYYLENKDLKNIINQFSSILKPGGVFFASMMDKKNYYFKLSKGLKNSSLRKTTLNNRLKETTYINFKNKSEMLKDFKLFSKLHAGYYDTQIREDEGSTKHIFFVGMK